MDYEGARNETAALEVRRMQAVTLEASARCNRLTSRSPGHLSQKGELKGITLRTVDVPALALLSKNLCGRHLSLAWLTLTQEEPTLRRLLLALTPCRSCWVVALTQRL